MKHCPFCGGEARIYSNASFAKGVYSQVRCKNKECGARGPLAKTPYAYVPWTAEHAARDYLERRELQRVQDEKTRAKVRAEAERAWNQRVDQPDLLADPVVRNRRDGVE